MTPVPVKFYQVGSFAVGNRLLGQDQRSVQSELDRPNTITSGHRACQGCGEALGARFVLDAAIRATGGRLVTVNATGCLEVFSTPYPESSWQVPWLHSLFGNARRSPPGSPRRCGRRAGTTSGSWPRAETAARSTSASACLSGMFERNDDVLYVCYDNQAYMNTGVQRSGATPPAARTATTQAVGAAPGNEFGQGKDAAAHRDGARDPLRGDRHRRRPARPRGQGREGDDVARARATCTCWCPARSAGARPRTRPSGWPGSPARAGCSRCSRPSGGDVVVGDADPAPRARRDVPAAAEAVRATCSAPTPRTTCIDRIQAQADRTIARYGLLDAAWRRDMNDLPFAITLEPGVQPGQPHRVLAHRSVPVYVDLQPPCATACPAGEDVQRLAVRRRGRRLRGRLARRSWPTTRSPP